MRPAGQRGRGLPSWGAFSCSEEEEEDEEEEEEEEERARERKRERDTHNYTERERERERHRDMVNPDSFNMHLYSPLPQTRSKSSWKERNFQRTKAAFCAGVLLLLCVPAATKPRDHSLVCKQPTTPQQKVFRSRYAVDKVVQVTASAQWTWTRTRGSQLQSTDMGPFRRSQRGVAVQRPLRSHATCRTCHSSRELNTGHTETMSILVFS